MARSRPRARSSRTESELLRSLREVARDRSTGAQGLALSALRALTRASGRWSSSSPKELEAQFELVADLLAVTQPAMGIFRRWAAQWRELARPAPGSAGRREAARWIHDWTRQLRRETPALVKVVRRRLPANERILTISRSSSVYRALTGLPRSLRPREVVALESRPGGEGRLFARDLRRKGLTVRLVPDREGPEWVGEVDRVLLGADMVYADGSVAHKVGTRALALRALGAGVPVIVVTGTSKGVADLPSHHRLPPLFDITPARAVCEYWTDRGVVRGGRWRERPRARPMRLSPTSR